MLYDISVIICTYNRAEMLRETLESWLPVQNVGPDVELIIVDNNSTDHTQQVVESFRPACPSQLRYVCETNVGLSYARNRGIKEASANIVVFVDDDVYFDKDWLNALLKAFNDNPEISCVGGKSIPKFEVDKPDWITEEILKRYGSTGSGDQDRLMVFPEYPFPTSRTNVSTASSFTMLTVHPPKPAPVILLPMVPSIFRASSTRVSSSLPVTS